MAAILELADGRLARAARRRQLTPAGRVYYVRFVIVGEFAVYDYSGAMHGRVIKYRNSK